MKEIDAESLDKIIIQGTENVIITEQEDMQKVVDMLKSMKLTKSIRDYGDGHACSIELYYQNGERIGFGFTSEYAISDYKRYNSSSDYTDDIEKLYDEFAKKYGTYEWDELLQEYVTSQN